MFLKFELSILFLTICYFFTPVYYVNPQLKPLTNEIFSTVNQYCKPGQYYNPRHTFIYFKKLKEPIVGQCGFGIQKYTIQLDPSYWNIYNNDDKFQLLVHEFSHCILFKDHVNDRNNYMFASMVNLTKEQIMEQFIKDLKEHCEKKVLIYQ